MEFLFVTRKLMSVLIERTRRQKHTWFWLADDIVNSNRTFNAVNLSEKINFAMGIHFG